MTPRAEETLVRLASWMPYAQAQELLSDLVGIGVSKATARRATLDSGQAALWRDEAEEERLKQELPQAPEGADKQQLSADGAMVQLVGGEWVEVKTLILGKVSCKKQGEVCTQHISTFSRLADAERFTQASLVETHRRGLERAAAVCAVQDGAEWRPRLVDYHRADAVRILDFAHAAEYLHEIGQAVQAAGRRLPTRWWWKHVAYGAGMRWERHHVNRMLALRNAVCNRRWHETWQAARRQRQQSRQQRRDQRTQARSEQALKRLLTLWLWCRPSTLRPVGEPAPQLASSPAATAAAPLVVPAVQRPIIRGGALWLADPRRLSLQKNEPHPYPIFLEGPAKLTYLPAPFKI